MKTAHRPSSIHTLLATGVLCACIGQVHGQARNAYVTIQPNATKTAFIHTVSWVALDSQYSGSVYDNPATTGVNEGNRDFINNGTPFGNPAGSAFEVHTWNDPVGQTRFEFLPGVEVRYQPPAGGVNSYAGGYVYMGTDGSDGAVASAVGNSTPKWDDVGAFTTEPNGAYGHGWDGVTGFRTVNPDGSGPVITNGDGYYMDTDSIDGSSPIDDVGMIFVGFDAVAGDAPLTGYMQTIIPIATAASSTDDYFSTPNFFAPTQTTWTSAYVEGTFTNNASVEVTVSSDPSYTPKLAVSGDLDGDLDVDNSDIIGVAGGFTGSATVGEFFGQYYRDGDMDGDMDVDNTDIITAAGNFTGAAAGNLLDTPAVPDLVYDPATGNVTLDADGGAAITGFQLESAAAFLNGNYNSQSGGGYGGAFEDVSDSVIADSDLTFVGLSSLNLGNILATGLDQTTLEALLTSADYGAGLGNSGEFDLVVVPEPSIAGLLGLCSFGLLIRRRRK